MSGAARRDPEVLLPGCGLTSPDELVATFAWTTAWRATCGRGAGTAGLRGQRERLGPLLSRLPTRISTLDRRFYGDAGPDPDGQIESAGFWHRTPVQNLCPGHLDIGDGLSTGPKTAEGKARIAEAQRRWWAKWREKRDGSERA